MASCHVCPPDDQHAPATPRPVPAVAVRGQIPYRYLRILHDWAGQIAEYQASIGNPATSDKASWMHAVLNPEWEDGRCDGLTAAEASRDRTMWAECGRSDAHGPHAQPDIDQHVPDHDMEAL